MRVGIVGIQHESNTFALQPTKRDDFKQLRGQEIREAFAASFHEMGGFLQGLDEAGAEAVPLFSAKARPSGTVAAQALDAFVEAMFVELEKAGTLDGLLVAPHGAGVSQKHRDMDGWWLTRLREKVGPHLPIICTLDPHANVSQRMLDACNATVAYRTNPHIDQKQCGLAAAELMVRTLRGEVTPVQAGVFPPMMINIEKQLTSAPPCAPLYALADEMLTRPGVLSNSIFLGFPYADVAEMGAGVSVVTDGDPALARRLAAELAQYLWDNRERFVGEMIDIDQAIEKAKRSVKPVCLLDMGDNVGGGSPADGTFLAHALDREKELRSFVSLYDPESVKRAAEAGVGGRLRLTMGGKSDALHGPPLEAQVRVRGIHTGAYTETEPRHGGGVRGDMGKTAVVETGRGLTLMLTSRRTGAASLQQLLSCGVAPGDFDVLVAKGVHSPVAAYQPVCPTLIRVNTPGVTAADMSRFSFRLRRRPLFPFEDCEWPEK